MNVIDLKSGKPWVVHPDFNVLAGEADFPLWFIREVKALLNANEVYAIAAGVGLIYRLTPALAANYNRFSTRIGTAFPVSRVPEWADGVVKVYRKHVVDSAIYEVDDILTGFGTLEKLFRRNTITAASAARALRLRRDDLESVAIICDMWGEQHVVKEVARIDALAASCSAMLCDDHRQGIARRLNAVFDMLPRKWWGVKGTL